MDSFLLKYEGGDADQHVIDAVQYGNSLYGTGRLYISVTHFCVHGEVLKPSQRTDIKCYASEGHAGCFETGIIVAASVAQMPLFADVYKPWIDWLTGKITEYIKDRLTGRGSMDKLVDAIAEQAKSNNELNHILVNGLLASNSDMADVTKVLVAKLPDLVDANTRNMKRVVAPIGRSCIEMKHFANTDNEFKISEPEADAIRSKADLEVDDMKDYKCDLISELNTKTGHCHLHLEGEERHIIGKINDPALQAPNNIYSKSLNAQSGFSLTAKAVLKEGLIHRLYVSDARDAQ